MKARIRSGIESALWHERWRSASAAERWAVAVLRITYALIRDLMSGQLTLRAMGLVYVTLLSIVPLLALSFSLAKAFDVHRQLEPQLYRLLEPLGDKGIEITDRFMGFVDNVKGDVLAGVGLVVLFVTAISMAQKVEDAFNFVWRVGHPRSFARRLSEYLSVILVGPVAMATALTLLASVESSQVFQDIAAVETVGKSIDAFRRLAPFAIIMTAFSFVYWFLPNTTVQLRAALAGGIAGGVIWAMTGAAFAELVVGSARTIDIYLTFAILMTALLWVFVCWLILLVGAQISFYVQNPDYVRDGYDVRPFGTRATERLALAIMALVASDFTGAGGGMRERTIAARLRLPGNRLAPVVASLEQAGLIARSGSDTLLPARDPARIPVDHVLGAVRSAPAGGRAREPDWPRSMRPVFDAIEDAEKPAISGMTVEDLLAPGQ